MHKHRANPRLTTSGPFFGPVSRDKQNASAHGGVCIRKACNCGAVIAYNVNGSHSESSGWYMPEP